MASASTKSAAFNVNAFVPDGILGSKAFDGVNLNAADSSVLDLRALGLGAKFTVGQVKQAISARQAGHGAAGEERRSRAEDPRRRARRRLHRPARRALRPARRERGDGAGERLVADGEVDRIARQPRRRGLPGRSQQQDRAAAGERDAPRCAQRRPAPRQAAAARLRSPRGARSSRQLRPRAVAGISLGSVRVADARKFSTTGVFAALPVNAISSAGGATQTAFKLDDGFEFSGSQAASASALVSITLPPALRTRDVLSRFAVATRGTQSLWKDAYATSRVVVKPVDFGVADGGIDHLAAHRSRSHAAGAARLDRLGREHRRQRRQRVRLRAPDERRAVARRAS